MVKKMKQLEKQWACYIFSRAWRIYSYVQTGCKEFKLYVLFWMQNFAASIFYEHSHHVYSVQLD